MNYEQRAKKLTASLRTLDPLLEVRVRKDAVSFSFGDIVYHTFSKHLDLYRRANGNDYLLSTDVPLNASKVLLRANLHKGDMHGKEEYNYLNDINYYVQREKDRKAERTSKESEAQLFDMINTKNYIRI
jgi:hypothetical protein